MPPLIRPGRTPLPGQSAAGFKPSPWNVQRRYVAPEWQWVWTNGLVSALPLWGFEQDFSPRQESGSLSSGGYSTGLLGRGLEPGRIDVSSVLTGATEASIVVAFSMESDPSGNHGLVSNLNGSNEGYSLHVDNDDFVTGNTDTLSFRPDVSGSNADALTAPTNSIKAGFAAGVGVTIDMAGTHRMFIDGDLVDSDTSSDVVPSLGDSGQDQYQVGEGDDGFVSGSPLPGFIYAVWVWNRPLTQDEAERITRDPFGPFRPYQTIVAPASTGTTVTVGLASETDAGTVTGAAKTQSVGLSSETDVGLASTADKAYGAGLAAETDAGLTSTAEKAYAAGLASETDVGLAPSAAKLLSVGLAAETDAGLAAVAEKLYDLGLASETDTGLSATAAKLLLAGLATETDAGLAASSSTEIIVSVGLAAETDSALAAGATKLLLVGLAAETDAGLTPGALKAYSLGLAGETDTALTPGAAKVLSAGLAAETDTGLSATAAKMVAAGLASESDAALTATALRAVTVGLAAETDAGLAATVGAAALDLDPPYTLSYVDPQRELSVTDPDRTLTHTDSDRTLERD